MYINSSTRRQILLHDSSRTWTFISYCTSSLACSQWELFSVWEIFSDLRIDAIVLNWLGSRGDVHIVGFRERNLMQEVKRF